MKIDFVWYFIVQNFGSSRNSFLEFKNNCEIWRIHESSRHFYIVFREIFRKNNLELYSRKFFAKTINKNLQQITIFAKNNEISREMYSKIQFLSEKFASRSKFLL